MKGSKVLRAWLAVLLTGVGTVLATTALATAAQAEPGYIAEKSETVRFKAALTENYNSCVGKVWIGLSDLGYIGGYATVECPQPQWVLHVTNELTKYPFATVSKDTRSCGDRTHGCTYAYTNTYGGVAQRDVRYCSHLFGSMNGPDLAQNEGYGGVCLTWHSDGTVSVNGSVRPGDYPNPPPDNDDTVPPVTAKRRADLVVHSESAANTWAVATSDSQSFGEWSDIGLSGWSMGDWSGLADVTGDGRADLVVHNTQFQRFDVAVADGTGRFGAPGTGTWLNQWAAGDWAGLGDVNGDGKADLVVHGESAPYNWAVALSNGSSFGGWSGIGLDWWSMGDFAGLADVTGDGKADLIVHGEGGSYDWAVAVSDGTGHFGAPGTGVWLSGWSMGNFAGVADVNGDGKADLVVHGEGGTNNWAVALSNGSSFGGWSGIGLSGWSMGDFAGLADVTGDGRADLVVHNPNQQRYDVAVADGTGHFGAPGTGVWLANWAAGQFVGLANVNGT